MLCFAAALLVPPQASARFMCSRTIPNTESHIQLSKCSEDAENKRFAHENKSSLALARSRLPAVPLPVGSRVTKLPQHTRYHLLVVPLVSPICSAGLSIHAAVDIAREHARRANLLPVRPRLSLQQLTVHRAVADHHPTAADGTPNV